MQSRSNKPVSANEVPGGDGQTDETAGPSKYLLPADKQARLDKLFAALKEECGGFLFYFYPTPGISWAKIEHMKFGQALSALTAGLSHLIKTETAPEMHPEFSDAYRQRYTAILKQLSTEIADAIDRASSQAAGLRQTIKKS